MKWTRIEPGVYHLGPYLVRKTERKTRGVTKLLTVIFWRVSKDGELLETCDSLREAKRHAERLHGGA